ncbi:MAG: DUF1553 domain-containing protein [Candidatus Omnitrophica bacterium]|nr:DUF1553 domain-containing protein [Candidatus Omnitrophota bacterium]
MSGTPSYILGALLSLSLIAGAASAEPAPGHGSLMSDVERLVEAIEAFQASSTAPRLLAETLREAIERSNQEAEAAQERIDSLESALRVLEHGARERQAARASPVSADPEDVEFFEKHVRPALADNCFSCHGPTEQKSGVRLDTREALFGLAGKEPLVAPGNPEGSKLIRVTRHDGEVRMPPQGKLPEGVFQALVEWVERGADWPEDSPILAPLSNTERLAHARETHWAFRPVVKPALPKVRNEPWIRSPIDRFILAKMEEHGIDPSPPSDRAGLLRRVTYDLIGLPPTFAEVQGFVADPSPDAYEKVVDRLLASPRYGERWARYWLDLARYSDTTGYVAARDPFYPFPHTYRDYVIRAFNEDLPYDRFLLEQLAADLLDPGPDKRPLAALGFLTLGRRGKLDDIIDDRIDVVTRGLLGLTVSCARCHDHKYDPVPSADYYSLYGVFRSCTEPEELPLLQEPDPTSETYQAYLAELERVEKEEDIFRESLHVSFLKHAREKVGDYLFTSYEVRDVTADDPFQRAAREKGLHGLFLSRWRGFLKERTANDPIFAPWLAFAALAPEEIASKGRELAARFAASADPEHPLNPRIASAFTAEATWTIGEVANRYAAAFAAVDREWSDLLASHSQIAARDSSAVLPKGLAEPNAESIRQALYGADSPANLPKEDVESLIDGATRGKLNNLRNAVLRVEATHPGRPDRAMVLLDSPTPFEPYVFLRGNPANKGESVPRRFLAVLSANDPPPSFRQGSGRLELARAIASPTNPLTARVLVNRVWMHHFGRPLVSTTSDFGLRGDPPSHPELLDHLAARFVEEGWSIKKLHRSILLSSAYMQSSAKRPEAEALDPENRLLWRQNRRRLDFEAMRDSLLAASGKLDLTMGGPSVQITDPPFTARRTVYSLVDRQNQPGVLRNFDFANPDAHSPARFRTTVPQQALFFLNSPFAIEQARALIARPEVASTTRAEERVRRLHHILFQREPTPEETDLASRFLSNPSLSGPPPPRERSPWRYGYGRLDKTLQRTFTFTELGHFENDSWRVGPKYPDPELGWIQLNALGGHPGRDSDHSVIRRWISPVEGQVSFEGHLIHKGAEGDGVSAALVSSREGILWSGSARNCEVVTEVTSTYVRRGDTLDLIVAPGAGDAYDSFDWHPRIWLIGPGEDQAKRAEWLSRLDFAGPPPPLPQPLDPWGQYAQVLLMTNELLFVD